MSLHVVMMCLVLRGFETKFSDHDMFHDLCNHDIYISDGYGFKLRGANQNFPTHPPWGVFRDEPKNMGGKSYPGPLHWT